MYKLVKAFARHKDDNDLITHEEFVPFADELGLSRGGEVAARVWMEATLLDAVVYMSTARSQSCPKLRTCTTSISLHTRGRSL